MYLIIVYDIATERVNKVHTFLKRYLNWVQNSVFEGEITESQYKIIITSIKAIVEEAKDSIIIYRIKSNKFVDKVLIGLEKGKDDRFI